MKKSIFTLLAILYVLFAHAQEKFLMPKFGFSLAKQNYSDGLLNSFGFAETLSKNNIKSNLGYTYGAAFILGITDDANFFSFTVQPEILYSQKGIKISYQDNTFRENEERSFNFLELPVAAKLVLGSGNLKGFIYGGPTVGYLMKGSYRHKSQCDCDRYVDIHEGEIRFQDAPDHYNGTVLFTGKSNVNRFDIGFIGGAGGSFTVGRLGMILIDARYGSGFSNFYKSSDSSQANTDLSSKNRVLSFSFGFAFTLD